ncbi:S-layer homology domain-containing protein [Halobacillus yeomjeoni]|uniref:S-layer homology domain-containing protein n=1 Tax=Halobacillus yeomjeoni TaxID=311194 RepID=UPI001CD47A15|nr:S-layer homology domain-containing protein [Halobacillus yeomjeoni]MCA0985203.1 S-layer homology domain-containing protein [Halobacillus yeomjeoni]
MRRFLFLGVLLAMVLSLVTPSVAKAEDDITGHFFEEDMRTLIEKGILKGYGDNTYKPEESVNRAEFTAFLVRSLEIELQASGDYSVAGVSESPSYSDVDPENDWFYSAVTAASNQGLVNGYPNGEFKPNKEISRQEMAVMIVRATDLKGVVSEKDPLNFTDKEDIHDDYIESVQRLTNLGIINGKVKDGKSYFDPMASTTRGQTSGVINRMLKIIEPPAPTKYEVATLEQGKEPAVSGEYDTFEQAKSKTTGSQVVMKGNKILWIKDGAVVSNKFTNIYTSDALTTAATYVTSGIEMKYLGATEEYVKVQIADTIGYVKADSVNLKPTHMVKDKSYYLSKNGLLYHKVYNAITERNYSYVYGPAPDFMTEGSKYYSWNGSTFYDANGKEAGTAHQYFNRMPLYTETQYTAEQLDAFIESARPGSPLIGQGVSFKKAEEEFGVNAMYFLSHAILESYWGESKIAKDKNNLFGINATDDNPYENARSYESYEAGILEAAESFIVPGYFDDENWKFAGAHLGNKSTGMNIRYASDPYWGQKIASFMYSMDTYLSKEFNMEPEYGKHDLAKTLVDKINVRSEAKVSKGNDLYKLSKKGITVQVLEKVEADGTWYKIAPKNILTRDVQDAYVYSHGGSYGTLLETLNIAK